MMNRPPISRTGGAVADHHLTTSHAETEPLATPGGATPSAASAAPLPRLDVAYQDIESVRTACAVFRDACDRLTGQIGRVLIGQDQVVRETLIALFADGHVLLEGVPGLGKTLLVSTLSRVLSLPFSRIQFTPDVMPADITGTAIVTEDPETGRRAFQFRPGPLFSQLVLADEINRATPKSQAALLEAMQERSISVAGQTHHLNRPFLVMATQNPIEQEGTYNLPEAQLDRFLFKIHVPFTSREELNRIVKATTRAGSASVSPVIDGRFILDAQTLAMRIIAAPHVQDFTVRLVLATHPGSEHGDRSVDRYISIGVSPRGAQSILRAAKVNALMDGRMCIGFRDIEMVAKPALRHRIVRSFEAESDGVTTDQIVEHLLAYVTREFDEPPQKVTTVRKVEPEHAADQNARGDRSHA